MGERITVENQSVEYKVSWKDEWLERICGFANSDGGKIYVGVDDEGCIVGVDKVRELSEIVANKIRDTLGIFAEVNAVTEDGKDYIEIVVERSLSAVSYRGSCYRRSGAVNRQLTGQALNEFVMKRMNVSWDGFTVGGVSVRDLDPAGIKTFRERARKNRRMTDEDLALTDEQLMDRLNLTEEGRLRRAAVLLFHGDPERWVPGAYVKIGYFETDSDLRYQDEIHGPLVMQVERVMDLLFSKYMKAYISYDVDTRVESYPFPRDALREAVLNAVTHKDYASAVPVQISVYEDRLYVANDCVFPEELTKDELLGKHKSYPHNPFVAGAFFRTGDIEEWGRGIDLMARSCAGYGTPSPEYDVKSISFMVEFFALPTSTGQKKSVSRTDDPSIEERILAAIRDDPTLSQTRIAEILGENTANVKYHICGMEKRGLLKREGTSQKGRWIVL